MRRSIFACLLCSFLIAPCAGASDISLSAIPNAKLVGKGVLTYAMWDIYEARLFAPQGQWSPEKPALLRIEYFRNFKGRSIADRSVQEMRKQGFTDEIKLAAWNGQMKSIFPDVAKGTILSAVLLPDKNITFYKGDKKIGVVNDAEFGKRFFDIWLSKRTTEPALRARLLGAS